MADAAPAGSQAQEQARRQRGQRRWRQLQQLPLVVLMLLVPQLVPHPRLLRTCGAVQSVVLPLHSASHGAHPSQMVECINDVYFPRHVTWRDGFNNLTYMHASVRVLGIWWSSKPRDLPVTVVTQATLDRLPQLSAQCRSWRGPLSAVVYTHVVQAEHPGRLSHANILELQRASTEVAQLAYQLEAEPGACQLEAMLVYEVFAEQQAAMLYPVNVLRNLARLQARTPLISMLDVDLMVSGGLADAMAQPVKAAAVVRACSEHKAVYVLPAFETKDGLDAAAATELADRAVSGAKGALVELVKKGDMQPFDTARCVVCHGPTDFEKWYQAAEEYGIKTDEARFEPWLILDRRSAPWHDVRFRGYGRNKMIFITTLGAAGFKFRVYPAAFIVHRPHAKSVVSQTFFEGFSTSTNTSAEAGRALFAHVVAMFEHAKRNMATGSYMPALDLASLNCLSKLPWWHEPHGGGGGGGAAAGATGVTRRQ